jgi:hypothetical protein
MVGVLEVEQAAARKERRDRKEMRERRDRVNIELLRVAYSVFRDLISLYAQREEES